MTYSLEHIFSTPRPLTEEEQALLLSELRLVVNRFGGDDTGMERLEEME